MPETGDSSIMQSVAAAQKWAADVATEAWQPIKNNPWTAGLCGVAGTVGLGLVFRAPLLRAVSAIGAREAATEAVELAPSRLLFHSDATVQATSLNINRMSLLQDMDARARTPIETYIKWLEQRTTLQQIEANTLIGKDAGHQIVIRKDVGMSFRRKTDALEIVDHETQTARLYTPDYGSMRTSIFPAHSAPGVRRSGPVSGRITAEFLADNGAEKSAFIRNWFYRSADGKSIVRQLNAIE
jgi:hypothetical protein